MKALLKQLFSILLLTVTLVQAHTLNLDRKKYPELMALEEKYRTIKFYSSHIVGEAELIKQAEQAGRPVGQRREYLDQEIGELKKLQSDLTVHLLPHERKELLTAIKKAENILK